MADPLQPNRKVAETMLQYDRPFTKKIISHNQYGKEKCDWKFDNGEG